VEFLYEERPTADQIARARKLLLPDTFYLYENPDRPGCPGCIGCEDFVPGQTQPSPKQKGQSGNAIFNKNDDNNDNYFIVT
jgi:hypothetical protein